MTMVMEVEEEIINKSKMKFKLIAIALLIGVAGFSQNKKWSLQECVDQALENNITVKQAQNTLLINEQDIIAAKGNFLPSVSASAGQGVNIGSGFDPVSNQRLNNVVNNSFNYNFSVNQTIFNGFRNYNIKKQAKLTLETNELDLARIKDDIALNVANTYLNVLFNRENLETAKAQYEFSEKQLEQVKELVEAGVQARADVFDAEATLANDKLSLTTAQNNYDLALLSLAQLLQVPYNNFDVEIIDIDTPSNNLLYNAVEPILNYAYENRNEIKVAEKNIENSEVSTEISKSGFYPSVSFGYGLGSTWSESDSDFFKQAFFKELDINKGHNFRLNVNIPIFSRFQNKTSVAQAKIREDNAKLNLEQQKLNLETNIQRAFADAKAAFNSYLSAKESLESQQLAFDNSLERYNIGNMNAFNLEQARIRLINAQNALTNAKYDFVFKTKVLDFFAGKPITLD